MRYKGIKTILFSIIFLAPAFGYLSILSGNNSTIIEPLIMMLVSAWLMIQTVKPNSKYSLGIPEFSFLLFLFMIGIKSLSSGRFNIHDFIYIFFFFFLYLELKSYFSEYRIKEYSHLLLILLGIILTVYIILAFYQYYIQNEKLSLFYIPNMSIFGILLGSQLVFILAMFLQQKKDKTLSWYWKLITAVIIILAGLLLLLTESRSGWLGFAAAVFYTGYQYFQKLRLKKRVLYFAVPFLMALFLALLFYKPGSTAGRSLIYKITAEKLKQNWLSGIGYGQLKVRYNEYQASYFSQHDIDSKEASFADNTFYAFNDVLQILIENGIIGLLITILIMTSLFWDIKKAQIPPESKHLFIAATASLICILSGALFSYPLQVYPILIQTTLCFSLVNSFSPKSNQQINLSGKLSKIAKSISVLLSVLLFIHFCYYFNYNRKKLEAGELKSSGFKHRSINRYIELENSYIKNGNMLYLYAQEMFYSNQLIKAKEILSNAKKYYCSNDVYKLSAEIEEGLGNYEQAEKDYKTAVYMVPNRMISRKNLLDFYIERKDTANAIYWANSIVNMPVKVPSEITRNIQKKVKDIIIELKK